MIKRWFFIILLSLVSLQNNHRFALYILQFNDDIFPIKLSIEKIIWIYIRLTLHFNLEISEILIFLLFILFISSLNLSFSFISKIYS